MDREPACANHAAVDSRQIASRRMAGLVSMAGSATDHSGTAGYRPPVTAPPAFAPETAPLPPLRCFAARAFARALARSSTTAVNSAPTKMISAA